MEITYHKVQTEVSDFKKNRKTQEADMFLKLEKDLKNKRYNIELVTSKGIMNCTSFFHGDDNLSIKTVLDENEMILSEGRALDTNYRDVVFSRSMPNKDIYVEAYQFDVNQTGVSLKIVKDQNSNDVLATVKEINIDISKEDFEKEKALIS